MYQIIIFIVIALLNYSTLAVDLHEALTHAYKHNDELKTIRNDFLGEIEQFPQAFSNFMPRISAVVNSNITKSTLNKKYTDPRYDSKTLVDNRQESFIFEQPLFNGGGSVAMLKAAQSSFRASRAKYYAKEQSVILNLIKAYIECYESKEKYEISESSVRTNKKQLETVEEKLKLGEATEIDTATARSGLAVAETNKLTLYANFQLAKANFVRLFGIEANDIKMPMLPEGLSNSLDELIQKSIMFNPSIDSIKHSVFAYKANEIAAKADLLPKVSFKIQTGRNHYNPELPERQNINSKSTTSSISVNIPIYTQGGAEYSKIRKAKNTTRSAVIQLDGVIKQTRANAIGSWEGFEAAKSKIIAASRGLEAAQISYDGTLQEEIVGSKTILDVLSAEEKLYNAKISKVDAYKASVLAAYEIKALVGDLVAKSLKLKVQYFTPEDEFKKLKKKLIIGF